MIQWDFLLERLSKCKPSIDDPSHSNSPSMIQDLNKIAELAESFTEHRSKAAKGTCCDLADTLDQEG